MAGDNRNDPTIKPAPTREDNTIMAQSMNTYPATAPTTPPKINKTEEISLKPKECVDELLKIKNLVFVKGNHDSWFMEYMNDNDSKELWVQQGGARTLKSYGAKLKSANEVFGQRRFYTKPTIPQEHKDFFNSSIPYYIVDNMIFVHGGFHPEQPISEQSFGYIMWDRQLIDYARSHRVPLYDKVFVGHSSTLTEGTTDPQFRNNLILLDTGAGNCGRLTLMNIRTEEYFQSDIQPRAM
jgi:serine/threonine protein phosphatase 1